MNAVKFLDGQEFEKKLVDYLQKQVEEDQLTKEDADKTKDKVLGDVIKWLDDEYISEVTKEGIKKAIVEQRLGDIVGAFWQDIVFGTGGIRGRAALTENELELLHKQGFDAVILKGPNTINDMVIMKYTQGVANFMKKNSMTKVVVGYDSRIQGKNLANLIASIFIANGLKVYLFEEASPVPELSFAIANLKADLGIEISASHNDKRYNGYKINNSRGAGLNLDQRARIMKEILGGEGQAAVKMKDVKKIDLDDAGKDQLTYLGGKEPVIDTKGRPLIDMHEKHLRHVEMFVSRPEIVKKFSSKVNIGFSAYYGAGFKAVPRLLRDFGFNELKVITEFNTLNGMFPVFELTQLPDPGDPRAAKIAIEEFKKEYGEEAFENLDILIGTDPDSDRMGLVVKVPEDQQKYQGEWTLLTADDAWSLLLFYRLQSEAEKNNGTIPEHEKKAIVKNHVTTQSLDRICKKFGIKCVREWVGFGFIADTIVKGWGKGIINVGAFEQSNGYSIGGGNPVGEERLGDQGHTLDKDGTLAALLMAEIAAFAKANNTTIFEMLDEMYLDPDIGYFSTFTWQIPEVGVFEGVEGELYKRKLIKKLEGIMGKIDSGEKSLNIAGEKIISTEKFASGKYDSLYWESFPDEGIRFYVNDEKTNFVTVRPSGTEAKIRVMSQRVSKELTGENIGKEKDATRRKAKELVDDIISILLE